MAVFTRICCISLLVCASADVYAAPTLSEVYDLALRYDPDFAAAEAAHRAGQEALPQARAALLPQLGVSAGLSRVQRDIETATTQGILNYKTKTRALNLTQIIYNQNAFFALGQAASRVAQSDLQEAIARQDMALRVAQAYAELSFAAASLDLAQAKKTAFAEQQQQAEHMYEAGSGTITDVQEAKASYQLAVAEELEATDNLHSKQQAMYKLTGQNLTEVASLAKDVPMPPPQPNKLQYWLDKARKTSLTIRSAGKDVEIARYDVKRARSQHLPVVQLVGSRQWQSNTDLGYKQDNPSSIGIQLSMPLFEGGKVTSVTRETLARRDQANEKLRGAALDSDVQVTEAFHGMNDNIARINALTQAVQSGEVALDAAQSGFKVGYRTSLDVLNAHKQLFETRSSLLQARYNYILFRLKLQAATGVLERSDLLLVDKWLHK